MHSEGNCPEPVLSSGISSEPQASNTISMINYTDNLLAGVFLRRDRLRLVEARKEEWLEFFFFVFLGLYLWHMEVPRLGVKLDL